MKLYIRYPDEKGIHFTTVEYDFVPRIGETVKVGSKEARVVNVIHDLGADEVTIETSEFLNSEVNW